MLQHSPTPSRRDRDSGDGVEFLDEDRRPVRVRPRHRLERRTHRFDATSTIADRTIDITTTGRRSGQARRIEIVFYRLGDDIYLSGVPAEKPRDWMVNLAANPDFVFHLKHDVVADLPARATVVTDPPERRRVLAVFAHQFNDRHGPDSEWPVAVLDEWVEHSLTVRWACQRRARTTGSTAPRC